MSREIPALDKWDALPDKLTQEELDRRYWRLPLDLRRRIKPEPVLSLAMQEALRVRHQKMNHSIEPQKYRSAATLRRALAESGVSAVRSVALGRDVPPPLTNRGGKVATARFEAPRLASLQAKEDLQVFAVGSRGKFEFIRIPRPDRKQSDRFAFVDWVNFTFKVAAHPLRLPTGHPAISDLDYVQCISADLYHIFGFGVCRQRESGLNFYKYSFDMGDPMFSTAWGIVCIGGQNDTVSITLKGQGLMAAKPGWEMRLFDFLSDVPESKITRLDLASDNFYSAQTLDDYLSMYHAGLFAAGGRPPEVEQAGNWVRPNGKGRTLYIGSRTSGKLLRIYEKGKQLANGFHEKFPEWVRVELELKNQDRLIPFEALLKPGQYLAGAYPALNDFHVEQERVETHKKTVVATIERAIEIVRHQFGRHIWALSELYGIDEAYKKIIEGREELPKSFADISAFQVDRPETDFIHSNPVLLTTI